MPDESIWETSEAEAKTEARLEETVATPVEANESPEAEDEVPPEPAFIIHLSKYGPGAHGIYFADGTPVGVWLHTEHADLDGYEVERLLLDMGLGAEHATAFGRQRQTLLDGREALLSSPAVQQLAQAERVWDERTAAVRAAFLAEQKKRAK